MGENVKQATQKLRLAKGGVTMYKILLLVRDSETKPLWTEYREEDVVFETDDLDALVEKVKDLLDRYTRTQIRVIQDMNYTLEVLFD